MSDCKFIRNLPGRIQSGLKRREIRFFVINGRRLHNRDNVGERVDDPIGGIAFVVNLLHTGNILFFL